MQRLLTLRSYHNRYPVLARFGLMLVSALLIWATGKYLVWPLIGNPQVEYGAQAGNRYAGLGRDYVLFLDLSMAKEQPLTELRIDGLYLPPTIGQTPTCVERLELWTRGSPINAERPYAEARSVPAILEASRTFGGGDGSAQQSAQTVNSQVTHLTPGGSCARHAGESILLKGGDLSPAADAAWVKDTPVRVIRPAYFFPFDSYELDVEVNLGLQDQAGRTGTRIKPAISAPEWEVTEVQSSSPAIGSGLHVTLQRARAIRLITATVLSVICTFILLLLLVREMSSVLEIAAGILFSLWGIRSILIPNYITHTVIVDHAVLILYLLLALVIVVRFTIVVAWRRLGAVVDGKTPRAPQGAENSQPAPTPSPSAGSARRETLAPANLIVIVLVMLGGIGAALRFVRPKS